LFDFEVSVIKCSPKKGLETQQNVKILLCGMLNLHTGR
jgi:hypothetical protein